MKFLILITGLIVSCAVKAQLYERNPLRPYNNHLYPKQKKILSPYYDTSIIPRNYDHSVLKIPAPGLSYKGNNNNGFNIYQSTPDNMYLIKPDSTVAFNMPVKKFMMKMEAVK